MKQLNSPSVEVLKNNLRRLNYSESTIYQYSWFAEKYLEEIKVRPSHLTIKNLDDYLLCQVWTSNSQQNQMINALKLYYKYVLGKKDIHLSKIERPRKETKLPKVLDATFLIHKLEAIGNTKHRAILTLCFSVGLRRSEILNLKIKDIDSDRMKIKILAAKGKKDREVPLTQKVLELLRSYFVQFKPKEYLFNGQQGGAYSTTSCSKIFKKYIHKDYSMHSLRHSCFSDLASKGVNLKHIADLAGHNNTKTTEVYISTSNKLNQLPLAV